MDQESDVRRLTQDDETMPPSFPPDPGAKRAVSHPAQPDQASTDAEPHSDEVPAKSLGQRIISSVVEFGVVVVVALLCAVLLKTFLVQPFEIPSESMMNTLVPGDRIMVNKLADSEQDLQRGDVVVFVDPGDWLSDAPVPQADGIRGTLRDFGQLIGLLPQNAGTHLVKRIIGMPGDHISCAGQGAKILVNGKAIDESYVREGAQPSMDAFDVVVPQGHIWVMGDNRSNSKDSRFHQRARGFGFVPIANIEGRAWLKIYPLSRFGKIPDASHVFDGVPAPSAPAK
ncbi:signal peptidase I [Arcanobacterium pluranimalium]|uniref:signal peptidase I n=1 Tax=Arcanobacterium pluranimalium TaxID=108028 RepID=UPI00195D8A52|nr:signal peptidase I [Arcanobacterium pluranimalium]MBM7825668.1 signal peptidase I [Arcanobacterium pluranimalium]